MRITRNTGIFVLATLLLLAITIMPVAGDNPPSTPTSITCTTSSTTIVLGDDLIVSGSISPGVSSVTVTLTYTKPDATTLTRTVTSETDGSFQDTYTPELTGSWKVKASWEGNTDYLGSTSFDTTFTVSGSSALGIPMEYVYIAIIIIIVIIAAIVAWWYKKKKIDRRNV